MIFLLFKPLDFKEQKFKDIPLFELKTFTLHELNSNGLVTLMSGNRATSFSDRYMVTDIDYTDNSQVYIANMKAADGVYKDEIVSLNGNVVYSREDGLNIETQEIVYDKTTSIINVNKDFIMYRDKDKVVGTSLSYNNIKKVITSTDVVAIFQLKEGIK